VLEKARVVYSAGFFITVSPDSILAAAQHCATQDKIYCMNLSAPFIMQVGGFRAQGEEGPACAGPLAKPAVAAVAEGPTKRRLKTGDGCCASPGAALQEDADGCPALCGLPVWQ
jgi:hypothetical protein